MKKIYTLIPCSLLFSILCSAGQIKTNPKSTHADEITSATIKLKNDGLYQVIAQTRLESFIIGAKNYAEASAISTDLLKKSVVTCKTARKLRLERLTECKIINMRFEK